jgi:hypothetical protein
MTNSVFFDDQYHVFLMSPGQGLPDKKMTGYKIGQWRLTVTIFCIKVKVKNSADVVDYIYRAGIMDHSRVRKSA